MRRIELKNATKPALPALLGACLEDVNHELYGGIWSQMIFGEAFEEPQNEETGVSGMWLPLHETGYEWAEGGYSGSHRQIIDHAGICNRGLNRSGMYFSEDKAYRGYIIAKADEETVLRVSLRGEDMSVIYTEVSFTASGDWKKYAFTLTSPTEEKNGGFAICADGKAEIGYAFLEPDEWGLYKGLHVRRDVGEALEQMGLGSMRFGGGMVRAKDFRWKSMIGPYENRKPYRGTWYPYSTFGFGILEFIELCEALDVVCIPDFNAFETEEDMRDFVHYALGTDETNEWVKRRMDSHHPKPYKLDYIQFGNEEKIDEDFADRFIAACRGVWSVTKDITMVIGDFAYRNHTFEDPFNIPEECTYTKITTLAPHKRMLEYAKECQMEEKLWLDIHWTSDKTPSPIPYPETSWSLKRHLDRLVPENATKLCVFELNAASHDYERGLANAYCIMEALNHSDIIPIMCSANCLQVDKHNDNGWDQGLIFMNNHSVWYQAAAYVNIMFHKVLLDRTFDVDTALVDDFFNYTAMTDGKRISIVLMNRSDHEETVEVHLPITEEYRFEKTTMTYASDAVNTAENKDYINLSRVECGMGKGDLALTLPSNTLISVMITP